MSFRQRRPLARAAIAGVVLGSLVLLGGPAWTGSLVSAAGFPSAWRRAPRRATGSRRRARSSAARRSRWLRRRPHLPTAGPRAEPSRTYFRITAGQFAGYRIRKSLIAYVPGKVGEVIWSPTRTISFGAGRYLGYTFGRRRRPGDDQARFQQHIVQRHGVPAGDHRRAAVRPHEQWLVDRLLDADRHGWVHDSPADHLLDAGKGRARLRRDLHAGGDDRRADRTDVRHGRPDDAGDGCHGAADRRPCLRDRLPDRRRSIHDRGPRGDGTDRGPSRALRDREPHAAPLQPAGWGRGFGMPGRSADRRPNSGRAPRGGRGVRLARRDDRCSLLAAAVRRSRRACPSRRGGGRLHEDPHVGHRHDRLEADRGRRPDGGVDDHQGHHERPTGSIVLMHLGGYPTFDALPAMVSRLRAAGLQPSTISALLAPDKRRAQATPAPTRPGAPRRSVDASIARRPSSWTWPRSRRPSAVVSASPSPSATRWPG